MYKTEALIFSCQLFFLGQRNHSLLCGEVQWENLFHWGRAQSVCKLNHCKLCQSPERHSAHTEWEKEREGAFSGTGTGGHVEVFIWGSSWGKLCRIHISPENALSFFQFPTKKGGTLQKPLLWWKYIIIFMQAFSLTTVCWRKGGMALRCTLIKLCWSSSFFQKRSPTHSILQQVAYHKVSLAIMQGEAHICRYVWPTPKTISPSMDHYIQTLYIFKSSMTARILFLCLKSFDYMFLSESFTSFHSSEHKLLEGKM